MQAIDWDRKFQNFISCLLVPGQSMKTNMQLSERLFTHVGMFNKEARWIVAQIVDELHLPVGQRLFKPVQMLQPKH